jgi:hypothetical protein
MLTKLSVLPNRLIFARLHMGLPRALVWFGRSIIA